MPFYTPNGLKIRFDPNAISEIVQPLVVCHEMNNILLDVERWENLPVGFTVVSASVTALLSGSAVLTISVGLLGYIFGVMIRELFYSNFLRLLIPLFLGSWFITLIYTIGISNFLVARQKYTTTVVLCLINAAAHFGVLSVLELIFLPIRIFFHRIFRLNNFTHPERTFVTICNLCAAKHGVILNWNRYTTLRAENDTFIAKENK